MNTWIKPDERLYEKIARAAASKTGAAEMYQLTFDDIGVM